jgi:hypothetical protein
LRSIFTFSADILPVNTDMSCARRDQSSSTDIDSRSLRFIFSTRAATQIGGHCQITA